MVFNASNAIILQSAFTCKELNSHQKLQVQMENTQQVKKYSTASYSCVSICLMLNSNIILTC